MKILITGASSGIGYALAELLSQQDHQVVVTARSQDKLLKLTQCHPIVADLSNSQACVSMFEQAVAHLGGLDLLINNAGLNTRKCPIEEISLEELDLQYAVNLRAPILLSREALKVMKPAKQGMIINLVSTCAKRSNETMSVYTAMKQGLAGFSGILMKEAQPHGIKVSTLYPGGADTNFRQADRPEYMSAQSVAKVIDSLVHLPADVVMHEMTFRPLVEVE